MLNHHVSYLRLLRCELAPGVRARHFPLFRETLIRDHRESVDGWGPTSHDRMVILWKFFRVLTVTFGFPRGFRVRLCKYVRRHSSGLLMITKQN